MERNNNWRQRLEGFRRRLYRSSNGKLLGVFSGIAESLGFGVFWTRVAGVAALFIIAGSAGAKGFGGTLMAEGFFYLLAALLMQPPRTAASRLTEVDGDDLIPPPVPRNRWAGAYQEAPVPPRVDLAQLDRQLESLNRRIQRMETIVTDRQYDWDRRLDS